MIVAVSGSSGLTNAYTSVLSATGSLLISGASRWDDICLLLSGRAARAVRARRLEQALDEATVAVRSFTDAVHDGHLRAICVADERDNGLLADGTRSVDDFCAPLGCRLGQSGRSGDRSGPRGCAGRLQKTPAAYLLHLPHLPSSDPNDAEYSTETAFRFGGPLHDPPTHNGYVG